MFPGVNLDPSKLTPQTIAEMSALMQTLNPEQMMKMQSLMHNSMAGFDVSKDMEVFEQSLPSTFKEKLARIMYMANGIEVPAQPIVETAAKAVEQSYAAPTNESEARLTILRSVAGGLMQPEEALRVLFP